MTPVQDSIIEEVTADMTALNGEAPTPEEVTAVVTEQFPAEFGEGYEWAG